MSQSHLTAANTRKTDTVSATVSNTLPVANRLPPDMESRWPALILPILMLSFATLQSAWAVDGFSIELGGGNETAMARANARWNWDRVWDVNRDWIATAFWEAGVGYWRGDRDKGGEDIWEVGITPVLRLNSSLSDFFWEGGIGAHFLSHDRMDDQRIFGGRFNFGSLVGFGWRRGAKGQYEVGYRFQHISNANTAMPNDGINFHQIRFGFSY